MTRQIIYTKLTGRPFTWEYQGYRKYDEAALDTSISPSAIKQELNSSYTYHYSSGYRKGQSFKSPSGDPRLTEIQFYGYRVGLDIDVRVELWYADPETRLPTTMVKELGAVDWSSLPTSADWMTLWTGEEELSGGTEYAIILYVAGNNTDAANRLNLYLDSTNPYPEGSAVYKSASATEWSEMSGYDYSFKLIFNSIYTDEFPYPSPNTISEKRLEYTLDFTPSKITVNGQDVGTSLTKDIEIPQTDNYTVKIYVPEDGGTIQRREQWLYYNSPTATPEDFGFSEAYLLSVTYLEDGSLLRIDDNPDAQLQGDLNQEDVFSDILIPWGKLEWRAGRGKILSLGVL